MEESGGTVNIGREGGRYSDFQSKDLYDGCTDRFTPEYKSKETGKIGKRKERRRRRRRRSLKLEV